MMLPVLFHNGPRSGSVITQFNLQRLPAFDWVQRQQRMDALEACAASNSTSTCDVGAEVPLRDRHACTVYIHTRITLHYITLRYVTLHYIDRYTHIRVQYVLAHPSIQPYMHKSMHPYIHTSMQPNSYTSIHPHRQTNKQTYIHIDAYIHTCVHAYKHKCIHTCMNQYMHILHILHTCIYIQ